MTVKIVKLDKGLKNHQTPETETSNVITKDFKCDKCDVVYKKEATLKKTYKQKSSVRFSRG